MAERWGKCTVCALDGHVRWVPDDDITLSSSKTRSRLAVGAPVDLRISRQNVGAILAATKLPDWYHGLGPIRGTRNCAP